MTIDAIASAIVQLFTSGAYLPLAMLAIYFGLRVWLNDTHWLQKGRAATIGAAVLAGLSQLVPILITGKTPSATMLVMAFGAAWSLYVSPHPTPAPVEQPKAS